MSRFLDFLRRIFRIKSPSRTLIDQFAFYKPPEWERIRQQALEKAKADASAADQMRAYTLKVDSEVPAFFGGVDISRFGDLAPHHAPDGLKPVVSIFDEVHEMKPAPLIMSKKPDTTVVHLRSDPKGPIIEIRADGLDAFCYALRQMAKAAGEAAAALIGAARVVTDADLIARYGTDKEIHYITHAQKARTRKKYRNRVLRRARRDERRSRHEKNRAPRA